MLEQNEIVADPKQIIACYNAGSSSSSAEFALITTDRLVYVKDVRTTTFSLEDIKTLTDDGRSRSQYKLTIPAMVDTNYSIEIRSGEGQRMRVTIVFSSEGAVFYDALESAARSAGAQLGPKG